MENVSYPNADKFEVHDMGGERRRYSPIRITIDEVADRTNEGIMAMNDKIEEFITQSVDTLIDKHKSNSDVVTPPTFEVVTNNSCSSAVK